MSKIKRKYFKIQQNESCFPLNQKNIKQFSRRGPKELSFRNFIFLEEKRRLEFFFGIKSVPGADLTQASFALFIYLFFPVDRGPQMQQVLAREEEEAFSLLLAGVQHHLPPFHRAYYPVTSISGEG